MQNVKYLRNIFLITFWTLNVKTMGSLYNKVELRWHRNRTWHIIYDILVSINVLGIFYTFCLLLISGYNLHFFSYSSVLQIIYGYLKYVFGVGFFGGVVTTWLSYMIKVVLNFCLAVGCRNMSVLGHLPKRRCVVQTD